MSEIQDWNESVTYNASYLSSIDNGGYIANKVLAGSPIIGKNVNFFKFRLVRSNTFSSGTITGAVFTGQSSGTPTTIQKTFTCNKTIADLCKDSDGCLTTCEFTIVEANDYTIAENDYIGFTCADANSSAKKLKAQESDWSLADPDEDTVNMMYESGSIGGAVMASGVCHAITPSTTSTVTMPPPYANIGLHGL